METLNGLIGKIPSNPLWAELLAEKMKEKEVRERNRSTSRASLAKPGKEDEKGARKPSEARRKAGRAER
jgi:hypothetical protein